ncbi:uracil-DNA glycosylase family protein [Alkalimarinus alittae]|uniref:Uracil-DNA glycosylase family protein n=1 Tax=Alkalimarinus alittae TaxID=2961619 RepID=A0ABY6MYV8_9ALTE|nr:uracil-DNA glycosylase family protein [Alkalimarinus alittae]UZE95037.1 uracil-DNA glycosylase family protein [Alkalimarinus alittae]
MASIDELAASVRACTICKEYLPLGPRPIIQLSAESRILIAGQAPGKKVHETGVPFDDASGKRLREWLGVSSDTFYDEKQFAILPMGFCYPGTGKSGDLAPRPECAEKWRETLLSSLKNIQLTLVIGQYAMAYHLPNEGKKLTDTVENWQAYWPNIVPLPHPSPRNNIWLKRNPWFQRELLPMLHKRVSDVLSMSL